MSNEIGLRIKELRKQNSLTQMEFSSKIQIDNSQLSKIEQGKLLPTLSQLMEMSSIFKKSLDWLVGNETKIELPNVLGESNSNYLFQPNVITVDSHNNDNIVLVPQKLKAGYLTGFNNPTFIQKLPAYRMPGLNNGTFRMFEVEGNSMFPTLPNKSYVVGEFVEDWLSGIKDNQLYAIISNEIEDGLVKRCLNRIDKYNNLICKSDNRRNYPTQNIDPDSIKEVWEVKLHLNFQLPDPADIYDRVSDLEAEMQQMKKTLNK
ncbi:XRE family transcriptional regulator [Chryseobacterium oncorhynchi]|uniref:HTH cro/C1-type domain-containing protein n=1 Tax=Chryseobacterium oncorhynchi TaxID=741074 RepID=A0A316WLZ0_9FLAO|nr:helix-turn-helix domain-containing protein [Chryseobacterium oncorhynchi]PWN62277.1 hypothetical protein C1638_017440 [Chryseobacterium oncorhynchi]